MAWRIPSLNRTAAVIIFLPAFAEWVKKVHPKNTSNLSLASLNKKKPIYLIPSSEETEIQVWFEVMADIVMDEIFEMVVSDPLKWPDRRTRKFNDYFEVEFHEQIFDLVREPLKRER